MEFNNIECEFCNNYPGRTNHAKCANRTEIRKQKNARKKGKKLHETLKIIKNYNRSSENIVNIDLIDRSSICLKKCDIECQYCGYGECKKILFSQHTLINSENNTKWMVIFNWSECLSDDENYLIYSFNNKKDAVSKYCTKF